MSIQVTLPGSKSITNRALLLAAMAKGETQLTGMLLSQDTEVLIQALITLGVTIKLEQQRQVCTVVGCGGQFPQKRATLYCGGSGITARFLMALVAMQGGTYRFEGDASLSQRPMTELLRVLAEGGVQIDPPDASTLPLTLTGQVALPPLLPMTGEVSSQYISAILMSAPLMKQPFQLQVGRLVSAPYVAMTTNMMAQFGVTVDRSLAGRYQVAANQSYTTPHRYAIEPDASSASYFLAAAAVTGQSICLPGLDRRTSLQGDVQFLTVLEAMGCGVIQGEQGVCLQGPASLQGIEVDMRDISDTMMTLAAIAPLAITPTTITGIAHTRLKESDRVNAVVSNLARLGVRVVSGDDYLTVFPGKPKAVTVHSFHDHRIAMAFAVLGLRVPGLVIDDPACVNKTFPDFFCCLAAHF